MTGEQMIAQAIAKRTAKGLSVEVTGIDGRDDPFVAHLTTIEKRDAYIARCMARGETVRILN